LTSLQILDGETLGRIWTGNVTHWDDPAIASLNVEVDLPHQPIILCYGSQGSDNVSLESITETFKRGMSVLSARFAEELARLNGSFTQMAPFAEGRGFTDTNSTTRLAFVQVRAARGRLVHMMTFMNVDVLCVHSQHRRARTASHTLIWQQRPRRGWRWLRWSTRPE
jgi:hypothetical protein